MPILNIPARQVGPQPAWFFKAGFPSSSIVLLPKANLRPAPGCLRSDDHLAQRIRKDFAHHIGVGILQGRHKLVFAGLRARELVVGAAREAAYAAAHASQCGELFWRPPVPEEELRARTEGPPARTVVHGAGLDLRALDQLFLDGNCQR